MIWLLVGSDISLKICGILSFFRRIDFSNAEVINTLSSVFSIDRDTFLSESERLNELEIVDLYENEIVKISDQILSSYLFYSAVFREKCLDFSLFLENFFPNYGTYFVDALNPVLDAFDDELIKQVLINPVNDLWARYRESDDKGKLFQLVRLFWFLKRTDALQLVNEEIEGLDSGQNTEGDGQTESDFVDETSDAVSLLSVLSLFSHAEESETKIAIELALDYLSKRPRKLSRVSKLLTEDYGFDSRSYLYFYRTQHLVIDALIEKLNQSNEPVFRQLFTEVARSYIGLKYQETKSEIGVKFTLRLLEFYLTPTPELLELRSKIWSELFGIYSSGDEVKQALDFICKYKSNLYGIPGKIEFFQPIVENDAQSVIAWIQDNLNHESYLHCLVVHRYLKGLERCKVDYSEDIAHRFTNDTFVMVKVVLTDIQDRRYLEGTVN
jgi:hypothetical protein